MPAIDNFWAVIPAGGGDAPVAAVPLVLAEVPARPHRNRAVAAPGHVDRLARSPGTASSWSPDAPTSTRCASSCPPSARTASWPSRAARLDGRDRARRRAARACRPRRRDGVVRGRPRDPGRRRVRRGGPAGRRGRAGRLAGHARDRAPFPSSAFGYIHLGDDLAGHPAPTRSASSSRSRPPRPRRPISRRQLPLERRHVRGPSDRAARPARRGHPSSPRRCGRSPRTSRGSTSCGPGSRRSRSTTPSPSRPRPRDASWWCRPLRVGRRRRLRLAGRPARGRTGDGPRVLGDAALVRSVDSTGLVVPRSGRWSRSWASTTSSWWTPPTPCWSPPGARPAGQAGGDRSAAGRPGRPHLGSGGVGLRSVYGYSSMSR